MNRSPLFVHVSYFNRMAWLLPWLFREINPLTIRYYGNSCSSSFHVTSVQIEGKIGDDDGFSKAKFCYGFENYSREIESL